MTECKRCRSLERQIETLRKMFAAAVLSQPERQLAITDGALLSIGPGFTLIRHHRPDQHKTVFRVEEA